MVSQAVAVARLVEVLVEAVRQKMGAILAPVARSPVGDTSLTIISGRSLPAEVERDKGHTDFDSVQAGVYYLSLQRLILEASAMGMCRLLFSC